VTESDINNAALNQNGQPLTGVVINHDPNSNTATLSWGIQAASAR